MTEAHEMQVLGDAETALRREAEAVAERFPDVDPAAVDACVREVYAELKAEASVETHLLALTRSRAVERLERQGNEFRPLPATPDEGGETATGTEAGSAGAPPPD